MMNEDTDAIERWNSIAVFYSKFGGFRYTSFLSPMVALARYVSEQPFAVKLFPDTSHLSLCVGLLPGYNPDKPFFSVNVLQRERFRFEMWGKVGTRLYISECPNQHVQSLFVEFVGWLNVTAGAIAVETSWLTFDVVSLAEGIYQDKAFDRLPILSDALMDAGCDNQDILDHCRQSSEHVRGCWVIDLLTGRK
jgi:hypothetical protein